MSPSSSSPVARWLLVGSLGPVLAALLAHAVLIGLTERRLAWEALEAEARTLAQLTAKVAAAAIEFDDQQSLDELLRHVASSPHFAFALVLRADGTEVTYLGDEATHEARVRSVVGAELNQSLSADQSLGFVAAVGLPPAPPARLVVGLGTSEMDATLRSQLVQGALIDGVAGLISVLVVLWLVRGLRRRSVAQERQREMLRETGRLARVGGWELRLPGGRFQLSEEAAALLGLGAVHAEEVMKLVAMQHPALVTCIDRGEPLDIELEVPGNGLSRWVRVQGNAERVEGKTVRVFGALQDVTEQRDTRERALAASRGKSQFLANTSHEIRTPLNGIIGLTELALETSLSAEQRGYLEGVRHSGRTMLSIVNDLLDISRIESGKLTLEAVPFRIDELLVITSRALSQQAQAKGLELIVAIPPGLPLQRLGDPLRLGQLVTNLLGNALKFTQQGEIELRLEPGPSRDELRLCVRDTGMGIPTHRLDAIFEPFVQSDGSTTRRFGGTGLGLTITRELATLMGGDVTVKSAEGVGSTFTASLTLPVGAEVAAVPLAGQEVLVIDGRATRAAAASQLLERVGARCTTVHDLAAAWGALNQPGANYGAALLQAGVPGSEQARVALEARGLRVLLAVPFGATPPGAGARTVATPLCAREVCAALHAATAAAPGVRRVPDEPVPARRLRVLLAEDNAINATLARRLVERAGHEVTHVWNGQAAVAAVAGDQFDLVLMDLQMPELDGQEATRQIRANEANSRRHLRIYAMTANAMREDELQCLASGMDGFLTKPVDMAHLRRVLDSVAQAA